MCRCTVASSAVLATSLNDTQALSFSRLSARTNSFSQEIRAEKKLQHEIVLAALSRARGFFQDILKPDDSPFDQKTELVSRRVLDTGANVATSVVNNLSPLSAVLNIKVLRDAATKLTVLKHHPAEAREARAEMLMSLAEIGVSAGAITAPLLFGFAGTVLLIARVASCIGDLYHLKKNQETKPNIIKKAALLLAARPSIANCLDRFAESIDHLEDKARTSYSGLKLAMMNGKCTTEMQQVLNEFYSAYEKVYPDNQRERKENMVQYLAHDPEWDLHVVKSGEQVVGGFTTFVVDHPKYGKQLMLEQMFPPRSKDLETYNEVWKQIQEFARDNKCQGIWHEVGLNESAPPNFSIVEAFHAQPALNGSGSESARQGDRNLRMSVCTLDDPGATQIGADKYRGIVLNGWIKTWAHSADPILKELSQKLTQDRESYALVN